MNKITVVCHKDHSQGYEDFEGKCLLCVVDDLMLEIGNLMIQKRRAEQREWVGLTYEDFVVLLKEVSEKSREMLVFDAIDSLREAIEAKLKEKNT